MLNYFESRQITLAAFGAILAHVGLCAAALF
jgi:hypothetical protein